MGTCKARLPDPGAPERSLLERAIVLARKFLEPRIPCGITADALLFVSGNFPEFHGVPDIIPGCGPLGGIHTVVQLLRNAGPKSATHLLCVPVDMPRLSVDALEMLVERGVNHPACVFSDSDLPALFTLGPALSAELDWRVRAPALTGGASKAPNLSIHSLLSSLGVKELEPHETFMTNFENVNTPSEYARCKASGGQL